MTFQHLYSSNITLFKGYKYPLNHPGCCNLFLGPHTKTKTKKNNKKLIINNKNKYIYIYIAGKN